MRGKDFRKYHHQHLTRITPAYAGKRLLGMVMNKIDGDHPRLCGEKSDMLEKITWNLGSPPPMRGKVHI